jgi:phage regulator Rha-like protein
MTIHEQSFDRDASSPRVFVQEGEVFATSRDVAAYFEKRHDNVLRDIATLLAQEPSLLKPALQDDQLLRSEELICSTNWCFEQITIEAEVGKGAIRLFQAFAMTREGFTLLAMGFTGEKALDFKLQYIRAFKLMEVELRKRNASDARNPGSKSDELKEMKHWMSMIRMVRQTFGKEAAQRAWMDSPLPQIDPEPVPDETTPHGLLIGFIQEKCKVTGDPTAFLKARVLLTSARSYAQEKGAVWPGDRRMSLALRHLCAVYADPDSGAKFWPVKRSDSGYCGIRLN